MSNTSAAIARPDPLAVVGEVLDRRFVLVEMCSGPGVGFYFVAYDLQALARKRLRLLPDDRGAPSLDWYMVDELPRAAAPPARTAQPPRLAATPPPIPSAATKPPAAAKRLEAAWFAQGSDELVLAELSDPSSFDDIYDGIARQAALDDLARVLSPEDLREHGLE